MYDITGVGYSCLDRICTIDDYPPEDGSTHISQIQTQGGGAAATAVVAASRLGKKTTFIGLAGFDGASEDIRKLFEMDGVDTSNLVKTEGITGLQSFVMVDPKSGSRTKFPQRDEQPPIKWTAQLESVIASSKAIHLDGTHHENAMEAARIAKKHGVLISLDGCHLKGDNSLNLELAKMADILIMNYRYPVRVTGIQDYDQALLECAKWGAKVVIGTKGSEGCRAVIDGRVEYFPAFKVKAVDTTGAGDVFHGAFLAGWLDGMGLKECIRFASAVAALKCTAFGGRAGIPSKEAALRFMDQVKTF